jgi:hypothetical protein
MGPRLGRFALHGEADGAQQLDGVGELLEAQLYLGVGVGVGVHGHPQCCTYLLQRRETHPYGPPGLDAVAARAQRQQHGGRVHHRQQAHQP